MPGIKKFQIPVRALTPIWTGDADRKTSYIKGSSIIGGLRFWGEALIRARGGNVCNGTDLAENENTTICPACQLFGCTGRSKGFSLTLVAHKTQKAIIGNISLPYRSYKKTMRNGKIKKITPKWPLGSPGITGEFTMKLTPLRPDGISSELVLALGLMLKWGTLGARDQYGHGIVDATIPPAFTEFGHQAIPRDPCAPSTGLSLRDFFFFKSITKENHPRKEVPFEIRNDVRNILRLRRKGQHRLRHYFCGSMMQDKGATKYNIGLVNKQLIGWGYYPREGPFSKDRDTCLDLLKNTIQSYCNASKFKWIEFNSTRDTEGIKQDWSPFLKDLLEGER